MLAVHLDSHDQTFTSEVGPVTIGSASKCDLVIKNAPDELAIFKLIAGTWILRVRGEEAGIEGTTERRVILADGARLVSITSPGLRLILNIVVSSGAPVVPAVGGVATPTPAPTPSTFPGIDQIIIGAAADADIRIDDPSVELRHAVISRRRRDVWVVTDQGSSTGTFVDGEGVTRSVIVPGSLVAFGGVALMWPDDFRLPAPIASKKSGHGRPSVALSNVTVGYPGRVQPALADVSLVFERGTLTAILGPSGIGKSTLCRTILGEIELRAGDIAIDGAPQRDGFAPNPQQVSFVPQDTCLMEELSVSQTLDFATRARGAQTRSNAQREADADRVLSTLGLTGLSDRKVSTLSGGEKKRVSIAQELVTRPLVLLLDEPSSGLDEGIDRDLMEELKSISRSDEAPTVIVVTHATNHLEQADHVCAIGAPTTAAPDASASAVRYFGASSHVLHSLEARSFADAMNALRGSGTRPNDQKTTSTFRHRFYSQGGLRPLASLLHRERMLASPKFWRDVLARVGLSIVIAGLLAVIDPHGLGTSDQGDNPKMLVDITLLVLLLCFWSLYLPTMRVVTDWPVTRREQRWGISARLHLLARLVWDIPQVLFVPVLTTLALIGFTWTTGPRVPWSTVSHIVGTLWITCVCCYLLGLLIGAMCKTPLGAIELVVSAIALMIVLSGTLFYLPDARALDIASNAIPSRAAIAELASALDVAQARGSSSGLDPKLYSPILTRTLMLLGIGVIGSFAAVGAAISTSHTMRKLDRKD